MNYQIETRDYEVSGTKGTLKSMFIDDNDIVDAPMWYHKKGLMQTATGYGRKLNTGRNKYATRYS